MDDQNTTDPVRGPAGGYSPRGPQRRAVLGELLLALVPLAAVSISAFGLLSLPPPYLWVVLTLHALLGGVLVQRAPQGAGAPGLGAANRVTLARATLVIPITALLPWSGELGTPGLWWIIVMGTMALILDGVDGRVARATGTVTSFGARFDMELDAFLLLALSILVWTAGPLGPWVILVGLLRYLFVLAGWLWPALEGELPASRRRKMACVVQGVALLVALGPIVSPPWAFAAAATALVLLIHSFGVDIWWLVRHRPGAEA